VVYDRDRHRADALNGRVDKFRHRETALAVTITCPKKKKKATVRLLSFDGKQDIYERRGREAL